jgi:beta-galactosidase
MRPRPVRFIALLLLAAMPLASFGQTPVDLEAGKIFRQGQFETMPAGERPADWAFAATDNATIVEEGGVRFLRVVNPDNSKTVCGRLKVRVPADWEGVRVSARARAKNLSLGTEGWHQPKTQVLFHDSKGTKLTDGWPCVADFRADTPEWQESTATLPNPVGEVTLDFELAMFNCGGVYDLAWIRLEAAATPGFRKNAAGGLDCWGKETVEELSPVRGRMVLNSPWQFAPAVGGQRQPDPTALGLIWVPGSWQRSGFGGVIERGKGKVWEGFDGNQLGMAWYQREIRIPDAWQGRAVILDLSRVSTDAEVFLNGESCGRVEWPGGTVDLTAAAKPGGNQLAILVNATQTETVGWNLMGVEPDQVHKTEAKLSARGIIGEVFLESRPKGAHVSDVFVQTSTRKHELKLSVELSGLAQAGDVEFSAAIVDLADGQRVKQFQATKALAAAAVQALDLAWTWDDPKLWDLDQPNLYRVHLQAKGPGLDDIYGQTFGFREFWVDGRKLFLNGTEFRLRPDLVPDQWNATGNSPAEIAGAIKGMRATGFNFAELWPWDHDKRGEPHFREIWAEEADKLGFPIAGVALSVNAYVVDFSNWSLRWNPERRATYEARMSRELRRYRNHPAIIIWSTSANFFGQQQDQNPRFIGMRDYYGKDPKCEAGKEAVEIVRKHDPTRPIMTHQGGDVGDIHTCNHYLCMIPLQEREEWLSHWAENGQMPYLAIEFGTPLFPTFHRGRCGYGDSIQTEPLYTEWEAAYFGQATYARETDEYRRAITDNFQGGQLYKSYHVNPVLFRQPLFQDLQDLFIRNTWRAWRTQGVTGGMLPWENRSRWQADDATEELPVTPYQPGHRGIYNASVRKSQLQRFAPAFGWKELPSGTTLREVNGEFLAWIGGGGGGKSFTDKTHSFFLGDRAEKSLILLNDTRTPQPFTCRWEATVAGERIADGEERGELAVAETKLLPVEFALPSSGAAKADGKLVLTATIGGRELRDEFTFRVFPFARGGN